MLTLADRGGVAWSARRISTTVISIFLTDNYYYYCEKVDGNIHPKLLLWNAPIKLAMYAFIILPTLPLRISTLHFKKNYFPLWHVSRLNLLTFLKLNVSSASKRKAHVLRIGELKKKLLNFRNVANTDRIRKVGGGICWCLQMGAVHQLLNEEESLVSIIKIGIGVAYNNIPGPNNSRPTPSLDTGKLFQISVSSPQKLCDSALETQRFPHNMHGILHRINVRSFSLSASSCICRAQNQLTKFNYIQVLLYLTY
jgi:hypothetical protein